MRNTEHPPGDALGRPEDSLIGIVVQTVADAPPKERWSLLASVASLLLVVVVTVMDTVNGTSVAEASRLTSLLIGILGITLLSVALITHRIGQAGGAAACGSMKLFRLEARVLHRALLAVPVIAVVAAIMLALALAVFVASWLPALGERRLPTTIMLGVITTMFGVYLVFAVRMVAGATRFLYRHAAEQAEAATRARAEATEAQLAALQAQMNPHFLFNALNTVASLVRTNGRAAEATVENLAEVLRRTLDRARNGTGTVEEEIDYLEAYLAVEQERWGDRLAVEWQIAPEAGRVPLPPMTLQPLVENALKHGLGTRLEGGHLRIAAAHANGRLLLEVTDDGIGFPPRYREGTGLGNLRQRLQTLYGESAELRVECPARGSRVVVSLPIQSARVPPTS